MNSLAFVACAFVFTQLVQSLPYQPDPSDKFGGYTLLDNCAKTLTSDGGYKTQKSADVHSCLAQIVASPHHQLKMIFAGLKKYCKLIRKSGHQFELIDEARKTITPICPDDDSSEETDVFWLPPGPHMLVYHRFPAHSLLFSLTFINTQLACGDRVTLSHLGLSLSLSKPENETDCTVILPGETNVTVLPFEDSHGCHDHIRFQQGRTTNEMSRELKICHVRKPKNVVLACPAGALRIHGQKAREIRFSVDALRGVPIFDARC